MITNKIVLVLGAGASVPYRFPTGDGLVRKIREYAEAPGAICVHAFSGNEQIRTLEAKLRTLAQELKIAQPDSIDEFFEHRPELEQVGKVVLAIILLHAEHVSEQYLWNNNTPGHWYRLLKAQMVGPFDSLAKQQLKTISFNYDRSLEHYLFESLQPYYAGNDVADYSEKINQMPFLHIYGSLGPLPWQSTQKYTIPYGPKDPGTGQIVNASKNIKIMHEGSEDEVRQNFQTAQEWLLWAHKIYFLGFGFHQDNVSRLCLIDVFHANKRAKATCLGLSLTNKNRVSWSWQIPSEHGGVESLPAVEFPDPTADCYAFLHDHVVLS